MVVEHFYRKERSMSEGISDPKLYRKLSEPFPSVDEAENAAQAFAKDLRELRAKHGMQDVLASVGISFIAEDGNESFQILVMHNGDELKSEMLAAYAFGHEQSRRQERIARIATPAKAILAPKRTK